MKHTGITRPVDELGRVVIPKELRKSLGINTKDLLEIHIEGDMIIMKKSEAKCALCASAEGLLPYNDKFVCKTCAESLKNIML